MSFEFHSFLLYIANELTEVDCEKLVYLVSGEIPAGKREALSKTPCRLFEELERGGHIGPGELDFLRKSLRRIHRQDLVCEVDKFDRPSGPLLTPKSKNYLESCGYRLAIKGGEHLVKDKGDEYVQLQSGQSYELVIHNSNSHRCRCKVKIDGHVIFPRLIIEAESRDTLNRPCDSAGKFKFFAVRDAPPDSGIDERNTEENGRIQVTFTPEVTEFKIVCDIGEGDVETVTCPSDMTDVQFHSYVLFFFNCDTATVRIHGWKVLGRRNRKLVDYGLENRSRVFITFGIVGGGIARPIFKLERSEDKAPATVEWIPGATTMQGVSKQTFGDVFDFVPNTRTRKVVLNVRLVAREDEMPLNSKGKCTPFILGNRVPPPV